MPVNSLARVRFSACAVFLDIQKVKVNHETFRDIRSAQREGAIGAAVGESRTVPRYFSCCQSRTFPMYISFWQLHSHLYLEKSRVIWDSVGSGEGKFSGKDESSEAIYIILFTYNTRNQNVPV